ncbi:transcriptional adapter 1-like isoform X2 [Panulirus ornatus]|uniref:transcriptional adapter 1-like isoform X2 n=1 Tax=Panulirus ornatus TaxID=150431 RepID=UPI003A8AAB64
MTSVSSSDHLNTARKRLEEALGPDKKPKYFHYMKQWFRMRLTKEDFDTNARELLALNSVHLHNEFLLAILTKCQLFTSSSSSTSRVDTHHRHEDQRMDSGGGSSGTRDHASSLNLYSTPSSDRKKIKPKKKNKAARPTHDGNFEPISVQDIALTATLHEPQAISETGAGYMSRSMCLLDTGPLKGRLLLAAWDHGITQVADSVANMLQEATQQCLKNILMAVISRRRGYRLREGCFMHSLGTTPPNPWLRNTASLCDWTSESVGLPTGEGGESGDRPIWPTVDLAEQNAAHLAACGRQTENPLPPISCMDLFDALQGDQDSTLFKMEMNQ